MGPVFVVIANLFFQQFSEISLVQNNQVVEQVPSHTPDPALGNAVLPGTAKSSSDYLRAVVFDGRDDVSRELRVAVKDQKPVWLIVSPSFVQLQYDPQGVRLTGHVAVQNLPPVVADDKEAVQNSEVRVGTVRNPLQRLLRDGSGEKPASAGLDRDPWSHASPSEKRVGAFQSPRKPHSGQSCAPPATARSPFKTSSSSTRPSRQTVLGCDEEHVAWLEEVTDSRHP
jgi:hypothetical protein